MIGKERKRRRRRRRRKSEWQMRRGEGKRLYEIILFRDK